MLKKFEIKRVLGPLEGGAGVLLANEEKAFVIYVGLYEAAAIVKEIQKQKTIRPLTHDLMNSILLGFDIQLKSVVISKIIDSTFCATLVLEQAVLDEEGRPTDKKREVHVDARASDSLVLALKNEKEILVTSEVYEKVDDISQEIASLEKKEPPKDSWKQTEIPNIHFDIPDYPPEEEE
ncbi:MAG: bifunctional nuclease family protein [Candidatus Brocadiae bacterium]|nr:bifunctional nuclease family protein [Candidatus Brocadiia bacterium]